MKNKRLEHLIHDIEQLLVLEEMVLNSEKSWYCNELKKMLSQLDALKSSLRLQYGLCLGDILDLPELPEDMLALARIIARVKRCLRRYETHQISMLLQNSKTNRYSFHAQA